MNQSNELSSMEQRITGVYEEAYRRLRNMQNCEIEQFASAANVCRNTLRRIRNHEGQTVLLSTLRKIARHIDRIDNHAPLPDSISTSGQQTHSDGNGASPVSP